MTTDEKTDSKASESSTSGTNRPPTRPPNTTAVNAEPNKLMTSHMNELTELPLSASDRSTADTTDHIADHIAVNNTDTSDNSDDCQLEPNCAENDVHMKAAESSENVFIASTSTPKSVADTESDEFVNFKLVYNKTTFDIKFNLNMTVFKLKEHIQSLTSVAPSMQKLCFKGILNDEKTLREVSIKNGVKVLLIGSTITDVIAVNLTTKEDVKEEKTSVSSKEPLCKQKQHKKMIDKGMPTDVMPAWKNGKTSLPVEPLHGMINKYGNKVRLTFKLEQDQLWVGTKERTEKLSMMSIRSIISEPIDGFEEYHIMGIQTGPTEASRIWIYWVPAQFVDAIKDTILGK